MKDDKLYLIHNVLVHDYLGVDIERIWTILVKEIPILRKTIKNMLM